MSYANLRDSTQVLVENQVVVLDTETTGLDCQVHEMIQIAAIALDYRLKPRQDIVPFYITIRPERFDLIQPEAMAVNKLRLRDLIRTGVPAELAAELFIEWFDKLGLSYTMGGFRKRVIPLGCNYKFDEGFIRAWLGDDQYNELFHYMVRDVQITGLYLNDRAEYHGNPVPFQRVNLGNLAGRYNILYKRMHDALEDARVTAEVYRHMIEEGIFA